MRFSYSENSYKAHLEHKQGSIKCILDTGATLTTMDINSLSNLLAEDARLVNKLAISHIVEKSFNQEITVASGDKNVVVPVMIRNVNLAGGSLSKFYAMLNISNESWTYENARNYMTLIGLDIVRAGSAIEGNKDRIELKDIDYRAYDKSYQDRYGDKILNIIEEIYEYKQSDKKRLETEKLVADYINQQNNNRKNT
ncbi:MAG: hypothetical protein J1E98_01015 [Lachnospiraceae bacterium]|nr:hypothetical protein [Lachnospiraceae bacterium]